MFGKCRPGDEERVAQEVSQDRLRSLLCQAVTVKYEGAEGYIEDVYQTYLIYRVRGEIKTYKIGYSVTENSVALAGEPEEVQQEWVRVGQEVSEPIGLLMRLGQAQDPEGSSWEVVICEPGFTKNGWFLPDDILRASAAQFEGIPVNLYELPGRAGHVPVDVFQLKPLLAGNKVGWLDQVRHVAGEGLRGIVHFLDSAKWIGRNLMDAAARGAEAYGLSWDAIASGAVENIEGRTARVLRGFAEVDSLDIVSRPAAGGKFIRAVAAQEGGDVMNREQILALIREKRPALLTGKDEAKLTDDELGTLVRMAMEPEKEKEPENRGSGETVTKTEFDLFRCGQVLETTLAGSGLPEHAQKRIRSLYKSRVFAQDELDKQIADERDYLARVYQSQEAGAAVAASQIGGRVGGGIGTLEKAQMALDKLFGLTQEELKGFARMETLDGRPFFEDRDPWGRGFVRSAMDYDAFDDVPRFRGIREAYEFFTGDRDVGGFMNRRNLPPGLRTAMDITSATFTYVLGNTMGRRLVRAYRQMNYKTDLLISIRKPVKDFRQQEAVLVGGFPNIETVNPEAGNYNEIAAVTDEESTYTVGQKGNLLSISRKTIINDDMMVILRLLDEFGRAFARTHGEYAWDFFVSNGTCTDGTAWFTSGHGNLGATALTHATALTAYTALQKMTQKDNSKRIGLVDGSFKLNLVGPPDINYLIDRSVKEEFYYTSNDLTAKVPNYLFGKLNGHDIPHLTDTNDWGLLLPPEMIDMVEMGYLNGREEPEFFVADTPQSEQVFVADKIRHKGRHEYAGAVIDYRSGYKAVVA